MGIFGGIKMSWKEQLHPKDDLKERAKTAWLEQEGGYNKPPQSAALGGNDCRVRKCAATKCKHNKNYQCTLAEIDIDTKGMCKMYETKGTNLYHVA